MIELQSNELHWTTNLWQIFDRLPGPLQAKWRKSVKLYRERTGGKEPSLKELSAFITRESPRMTLCMEDQTTQQELAVETDPRNLPLCRNQQMGHQLPLWQRRSLQRKLVLTKGLVSSCLQKKVKVLKEALGGVQKGKDAWRKTELTP